MAKNGILLDYGFCCDCHTCEVACQKEHGYAPGQFGVKVTEVGPFRIEGTKKYVYDCTPVFTNLCDMCAERVGKGKLPMCVQHCQTACLSFGPVDELARQMDGKRKQSLIVP